MTEQLKEALRERAREAGDDVFDLEAIMRVGDRGRRRRHLAVAAALTAAVAVAGGLLALTTGQQNSTEVAPAITNGRPVTYAEGSTVHYGDRSIDVGHTVRDLAVVDNGAVFTGADGAVYFTDGSDPERIGHGAAGRDDWVKSGASGYLVTWIDATPKPGGRSLVVYDTRRQRVVSRAAPIRDVHDKALGDVPEFMHDGPGRVAGIDGHHVYWYSSGWLQSTRPDFDAVMESVSRLWRSSVVDVVDGRFVYDDPRDRGGDGMTMSPKLGRYAVPLPAGTRMVTPNGAYAIVGRDGDDRIHSVPDGADVTPAHDGYESIHVTQIGGATTVVAIGRRDDGATADLLRCGIGGSCEPVVTGLDPHGTVLPS